MTQIDCATWGYLIHPCKRPENDMEARVCEWQYSVLKLHNQVWIFRKHYPYSSSKAFESSYICYNIEGLRLKLLDLNTSLGEISSMVNKTCESLSRSDSIHVLYPCFQTHWPPWLESYECCHHACYLLLLVSLEAAWERSPYHTLYQFCGTRRSRFHNYVLVSQKGTERWSF